MLLCVLCACVVKSLCFAGDHRSPDRSDPAYWLGGAGYASTPTVRAEVFVFAAEPTVRLAGKDRYEITFAVTVPCDVTVAIGEKGVGSLFSAKNAASQARNEGEKRLPTPFSGRIVRHLASGVLGPNAPEPFQKNALTQTLIWDGKDDRGRYVPDPAACEVRVSLGLKPFFAGIYGWHPKDNTGEVAGLGAGPEGVFVLEGGLRPQIRQFDHSGAYQRTVFPPPADTPQAALRGMYAVSLPDGRQVLRVEPYGALLPEWYKPVPAQTIGVGRGRLVIASAGTTVPKKTYRLQIATGGPVDGRIVDVLADRPMTDGQHFAASPDGRWVYVSGLVFRQGSRSARCHAVYRFGWDAPAPLIREAFFGEDERTGSDDKHLLNPTGVAVDAAGRVYVADTGNHRVVILSPGGAFLKAIAVPSPVNVGVHVKTGAIYVQGVATSGPEYRRAVTQRIVRFAAFDHLAEEASVDLPPLVIGRGTFDPLFCLDSWADPPRVWLTRDAGGIIILADRGDRFELVADWRKEVTAAGLIPGAMYGGRMPKVVADPVRPYVYYHPNGWANAEPFRYHLGTGRCEQVHLPSPADDIAFDAQGRLYCRAFKAVSRHNAETFEEIPFDYGEPVTVRHTTFKGAIPLVDMGGAKAYQDGFGVGVDGRIVVVSNIFSWAEFVFQRRGVYDLRAAGPGGFDSQENFLRTRERFLADAYRLPLSPGRNVDNQGTVWLYDANGRLEAADLIKGPITGTTGAGVDRHGAVYVAANYNKLVNGEPFVPDYPTGTLIKAPKTGARIVGTWSRAPAPLDARPDRPADFRIFAAAPNTASLQKRIGWVSGADRREIGIRAATTGGTQLWQTGLEWAYPGVSEHVCATGACTCPTNRFALDYYARSFVPEAYRFSVGVVDTGGNLITHIGRYGNADSGRGPDSPVPVGGDGLAFAFPSFLSVIDGWLFVSDAGNNRIVRVGLGYHQERHLPIPR